MLKRPATRLSHEDLGDLRPGVLLRDKDFDLWRIETENRLDKPTRLVLRLVDRHHIPAISLVTARHFEPFRRAHEAGLETAA